MESREASDAGDSPVLPSVQIAGVDCGLGWPSNALPAVPTGIEELNFFTRYETPGASLLNENLIMAGMLWGLHAAAAGGVPLVFAWERKLSGAWTPISIALVIFPFLALVAAPHFWPVGGLSSAVVRLMLLTAVVFSAQVIMLFPSFRLGSVWRRVQLLVVSIAAVIPIQLLTPALPD